MGTPVSALLTGHVALASSAALAKPSASSPVATPRSEAVDSRADRLCALAPSAATLTS
jgi:hypothetical protein